MVFLRKILFPLAFIYWIVTFIRNLLYDIGIFRSQTFNIPIIAVGNLSVGGTGKTPQIEYLIRLLREYKVATLSRGYKRESKGFVLANENTSARILGDEPFQFYSKFPEVLVAVDANRRNGIAELLKYSPDVILLDDAFQHRKVKVGFYILLTTYDDLFCNDFILPFGNLREPSLGKKRANMIIVTKCPSLISELTQENIKRQLNVNCPVFFSTIEYDEYVYAENEVIKIEDLKEPKLLLAGIAKPDLFFDFLGNEEDEKMVFPDHHNFSDQDIKRIKKLASNKKIITTEKDFVRLKGKFLNNQLFYLPIKSRIIENENNFNSKIKEYVGKGTRNG
ncbi:tetraacyldisaccharide 4'-kinase [Flavobacterium sediminilitoris]|uniref:Tetraacyldisaccharide 4'-kinase n=1 Tax=Flavobacterium sediminilitoris TaxID=2024526 RepID=A0ABY4HI50_9FLAO|nr:MULTISPECIES: tetraacyldisaccharide 4'-kinase [Flavobacterium]UOX32258.1 tetraacyldisaccharide 4'-kinase [Flavobacterium sediminilitoris]